MQSKNIDLTQLCHRVYMKHAANDARMVAIKDKYEADCLFTVEYLLESVNFNSVQTFNAYMHWFGELAYFLHFDLTIMKQHFGYLRETLSEQTSTPLPIFDEGLIAFEQSYHESQHINVDTENLDPFIDALISMKRNEATQMILSQAEAGMPIKDIYFNILQPTLYQIGYLWQRQRISVAKEHYATAVIQHIIGQLYPYLFSKTNGLAYSFTGVCVGQELHEIGMRMVTDFFEMEGYDTYYLGSNLPTKSVISQLREQPTNILGISATTPMQLEDVQELIQHIRQDPALRDIKVLVGGRAFNNDPSLYKSVNADGYAPNAYEALKIAASWMEG